MYIQIYIYIYIYRCVCLFASTSLFLFMTHVWLNKLHFSNKFQRSSKNRPKTNNIHIIKVGKRHRVLKKISFFPQIFIYRYYFTILFFKICHSNFCIFGSMVQTKFTTILYFQEHHCITVLHRKYIFKYLHRGVNHDLISCTPTSTFTFISK